MSEIYDVNQPFDFDKLVLTKPIPMSGGNYFIKCLVNNSALYIQPPKCKTRQGILKAGKRFYTDLLFTNEDVMFIQWMENLENHCQQYIYKNREKWFDGEMELHDIENYFTSPLKLFKSGKYYTARTNISTVLGNIGLKIYDENENEVSMESINDKTNVITILEIQGIKCSTRSFQIEFEVKQMMVLKPTNLFDKCIIKSKSTSSNEGDNISFLVDTTDNETIDEIVEVDADVGEDIEQEVTEPIEDINDIVDVTHPDNHDEPIEETDGLEKIAPVEEIDGMQEVEFNLEELGNADGLQIKNRKDVYYEMYQEARRKAKIARDLALSSYLEVKRIKNTYMLDDIKDSDDSDLEMDDDEDSENEN